MNSQKLLLALAFALLGSGMLTWQLNKHLPHGTSSAQPLPHLTIVVAAHNLVPGDKIIGTSVTTITVPGKTSLAGVLRHSQDVMGRTLLVPVAAGELILMHDLSSTSENDAPDEVPVGMRLISISGTDQPQEGAELLEPGSHVDVLVSYRAGAENSMVTSVVLQNVLVENSEQKASVGRGITPNSGQQTGLLVTPEQAAQLVAASSLGKLTYTLRNQADADQRSGLSHVTLSAPECVKKYLNPSPSPSLATPQRHARAVYAVETLAGGKTSVQTFQDGQP